MRGLIDRRARAHESRAGLEELAAVARASWLSDEVVLFSFTATTAFERTPQRAAPLQVEGQLLSLPSLTVCAAHGLGAGVHSGVITIKVGERAVAVSVRQLLDSTTDLATLARDQLAGLDADSRAELVSFLSALPLSFGDTPALTASLRAIREALRERQPLSFRDADADLALGVDAICRVDRSRFYVHGWVADPSAPMLRLTALSPEGERVDLSESAVRYPRTDIAAGDPARAGFACTFETRAPASAAGWVFTLCDARERCVETPEIALVEDDDEIRRTLAAAAGWDFDERPTLLAQHVEPAFTGLQAALRDRIAIASVETFGVAHDDPAISIVLSLDHDGELLEHHLAQIARDAVLRACELVCVQDGPQDVERCRWRAKQLFELYGVPFSLAVLTERGGAALARAAGASVSSAQRLLFLDAGVFAPEAGWLSSLAGFHAAAPGVGAVSGKLVGPDGAIRHAGFTLERRPQSPEWGTSERFAGLHSSLPAANVSCPVPAVSGGCMLVEKARYAEAAVDGWRFPGGGHADRDACLRMAEAGHENWYLPRVALLSLRVGRTRCAAGEAEDAYNGWLLNRLGSDRFERVAARCTFATRAAA